MYHAFAREITLRTGLCRSSITTSSCFLFSCVLLRFRYAESFVIMSSWRFDRFCPCILCGLSMRLVIYYIVRSFVSVTTRLPTPCVYILPVFPCYSPPQMPRFSLQAPCTFPATFPLQSPCLPFCLALTLAVCFLL